MIPEEADEEEEAQEIPLPNVKSHVLAKVIEFCRRYAEEPMSEIEKPLKSANMHEVVQEWYANYVDVDQELLFELILAANYMDIKPLLDLTCATVASMIKGKTPEEIRKTFNIVNDFTPEEEAQLCPVIDQTKVGAGFEEGSPVKPRQDNRGGWVLMCKCCVDGASKACARQLAGVELAYAGPADVDDLERFLDTHDVQLNPVQKSAVKFDGPSLPTGSEDPDADRPLARLGKLRRHVVARDAGRRVVACASLEVVAFSAATRELGMREGFRTDSTRDPSRRVVAMGKVPGKRSGMRMAPIGLDKDLEEDDDYENPPPGQ
ncbi:hypothetical protein JL720_10949 [Aureococcus anophagefferens]|nr:hypothetical protein JL720_10949 [Aureococcus anophagefferens]